MKLKHAFFSKEGSDEYLHVVSDYYPETVYSFNKYFTKNKKNIPDFLVKLFSY